MTTFLMTEVEGATRLWERRLATMPAARARHDQLVAAAVEEHGGTLVKTGGERDATFSVFATAPAAALAAIELQRSTASEQWPDGIDIRVKAAIHTGEAHLREGDYFGPVVNRCARIKALAHGDQTILSQATADALAGHLPAGASLLDLGSHRLKDLTLPERIYQLCHPDLQEDFPPLRSLDAVRNNLPVQQTSFVGREEEMAQVRARLVRTRLLTITGSGGSGKTRLALQIAADVVDEYPDGVWLAELAPLSDSDLVPQQVVNALGLRDEPGRTLTETLIDYLRGKHLLLVLDNCEHVIRGAAELAHAVARNCRRVSILVTTRQALGLPGETLWRVPSMPLPAVPLPTSDGRETVEALLQYDAIRLFLDRAREARPGFELDDVQGEAVAEIVRQVDGIPLAIELAAARVKTLLPSQLAIGLAEHFRVLTDDGSQSLPRQRTLQALIDWSYQLLSEPERCLLRRLSVFSGGCGLEAAEHVCAGPGLVSEDVLDELAALAEKSLVVVDLGVDTSRYSLLATIRQYGSARLGEAGEVEGVEERYRRWFVGVSERAESELFGPDQMRWMDELEADHDNLRRVVGLSVDAKDVETRYRLAAGVWRFLWIRGHLGEGRTWLDGVLRDTSAPVDVRARALHAAGALAWDQGDFGAARYLLSACLNQFSELGDARGFASALLKLGSVLGLQGGYQRAEAMFEESLEMARLLDDRQLEGETLANFGRVLLLEGRTEEARRCWERALEAYNEVGDQWGIMASLGDLGEAALRAGDHDLATRLVDESLSIARRMSDKWRVAQSHATLGELARLRGDWGRAVSLHRAALVVRREIGERNGMAESLEELAVLASLDRQPVRAVHLLAAADALRATMGAPLQPRRQVVHDECVVSIRLQIGPEPFERAWNEGRALPLEEVLRIVGILEGDSGSVAA